VSDFLDVKRGEIQERLRELRPLVEEFQRLEAAAAALDSVPGARRPSGAATSAGTATRRRRTTTTTRRRTTAASGGSRRPGRRRGSGTRAAQALSLVQGQPGITIPELANKMGIKQNYLYRVLPGLEQEGKVKKEGRGWVPAAA